VAAHTLALLLALERGVVAQHNRLAGGDFNIYVGGIPRRLRSCTAGILGLGRIGRAVAARLRMFYGRVIAFDPYVAADLMDAHGVDKVDFARLLAESDALTLHCPLSDETRRILNADAFARMKTGALVINAARGDLIDPQALLEALTGGPLAGAGIDVFFPEDPHRDRWYAQVVRMPNVVVTSHRAFLSRESEISQRRRAAESVRRALETGCPPHVGLLT
jgi:phosphoglycerate dehydrogenase-like enzyme